MDYRGRASLGRRHDNLVLEQVTGSCKSGIRRSRKGRRKEEAVATRRWKIYRKVGLSSSHNVLCIEKDAD